MESCGRVKALKMEESWALIEFGCLETSLRAIGELHNSLQGEQMIQLSFTRLTIWFFQISLFHLFSILITIYENHFGFNFFNNFILLCLKDLINTFNKKTVWPWLWISKTTTNLSQTHRQQSQQTAQTWS